jgi:hypothetical protein
MLQVFHNDRFVEYMLNPASLHGATMRRVALIETDDPQEAYQLTNNINNSWIENSKVPPTGFDPIKGVRSTSVGDMIVKGTPGDPGSKHLVVEPLGFRELTRDEICSLTYALPLIRRRS